MFAQILDLRSQSSQGHFGRKQTSTAAISARASGSSAGGSPGNADSGRTIPASSSGYGTSAYSPPRSFHNGSPGGNTPSGGGSPPREARGSTQASFGGNPAMSSAFGNRSGSIRIFRSLEDSGSSSILNSSQGDAGTGGTRPSPKPAPTPKPQPRNFSPKMAHRQVHTPSPKQSPQRWQDRPGIGPVPRSRPPSISVKDPALLALALSSATTPTGPPQVGFDAICAMLSIHLASHAQLDAASAQLYISEGEGGTGSKSDELHFRELVKDTSEQSGRLRRVLQKTLESRQTARKAQVSDQEACLRAECERLVEEKSKMSRAMAELVVERDRLNEDKQLLSVEKMGMVRRVSDFQAEGERKSLELAKLEEAHKSQMNRQLAEFQVERELLEQEKAEMLMNMSASRVESERKMKREEAEMAKNVARLHDESERKIALERTQLNNRLALSREQTEKQLHKERQVTKDIMHVLRELPPLQTAMEIGDLRLLEEEMQKWQQEALPERFGDCKGVVDAVVKLAQERVVTWRGVEHMWRDVMRDVEHLPSSLVTLTQQSQRIFRVIKESQLTKIDLVRSDPKAIDRACQVLLAWQERAMPHSNEVQKLIVRKVVMWPQLGSFDFADLDICLRLVDRGEGCEAFLSRARDLVENNSTTPQELKGLLSHIETMLFFLKYTTSEDLAQTHSEFRKQAEDLEPATLEYLRWAEQEYPPGSELVRVTEGTDLMDVKNVSSVLQELRKPRGIMRKDGCAPFREIFYQWALAMHSRFSLLVLPHHTQAVCLLAFRRFLETSQAPRTLIAQVGTGEGKSMIIAALAVYVVVALKKKVHVVIDDETLLERDFEMFKRVFDAFEVPGGALRRGRALTAVLCVSEEAFAARRSTPCLATRIDADADVCYCEAKHVQSFYASIARSEAKDFSSYAERVLILDEVDALVIDEEPNDVFVYPNTELSEMATSAAAGLVQGRSADASPSASASPHPAAGRVASEMAKEWARGKQMVVGKDFIFLKETGKYVALHAGRANPKAWSLALECRNFQDGLSRTMLFQERLFVASRPRVFRKYHRILGLSGSIGSKPEQAFLRETYGAVFFKVPPFLKTCKGSPFHEAVPVPLGHQRRAVFVESSAEAQLQRLAEVAFEARERVPVLVIARDRGVADHFVERLRGVARSRGLGAIAEDVVRSLSRTLYESHPEQWKENLNRATLPCGGDAGTSGKSWRVTITDPRGARGTDYRMDDLGVDAQGGLLLIPTAVPTSRREWTQFLGRTARQDCKGQYCCILGAEDYRALTQKYREALPNDGGPSTVETVLRWGDREAAERIRKSAALYNCGLRMNELCEEVFGNRPDILNNAGAREILVEACQRMRWMSLQDLNQCFRRLPDFDPSKVATEAREMGRPEGGGGGTAPPSPKLDASGRILLRHNSGGVQQQGGPKVVLFCLDWSASMRSQDTGTSLSRFETCLNCILRILHENVRDCDFVGVVVFGPDVQVVIPPTPKGQGGAMLAARIAGLRPQIAGGTRFYDAVAHCLQLVNSITAVESRRWLVCLTDGDDLGSSPQNKQGEQVFRLLQAGIPRHLNMVIVTVGSLKAVNVQIINAWVERVSAAGGLGKHLPEKDASSIAKAFGVVAECLSAEVGGAVEC